jgi:hypothetical protein
VVLRRNENNEIGKARKLLIIYINSILHKLSIICCGATDFVTAFADNITVLIDSPDKIDRMKATFDDFELTAAAKVNYNKTFAIKIGCFQEPWITLTPQIKILQSKS